MSYLDYCNGNLVSFFSTSPLPPSLVCSLQSRQKWPFINVINNLISLFIHLQGLPTAFKIKFTFFSMASKTCVFWSLPTFLTLSLNHFSLGSCIKLFECAKLFPFGVLCACYMYIPNTLPPPSLGKLIIIF